MLPDLYLQKLDDRRGTWETNSAKIVSAINEAFSASLQSRLHKKLSSIIINNASIKSKMKRLQSLTTEARQPVEAYVPCKAGCSYCCHIRVGIYRTEAELIGEVVGRIPVSFPRGFHTQTKDLLGRPDTPCPFLINDACSIYDVRPIVCRNHVVTDVDNLLCHFGNMTLTAANDNRAVLLPHLQAGPIFTAYHELNNGQAWADIRQFFPMSEGIEGLR